MVVSIGAAVIETCGSRFGMLTTCFPLPQLLTATTAAIAANAASRAVREMDAVFMALNSSSLRSRDPVWSDSRGNIQHEAGIPPWGAESVSDSRCGRSDPLRA